MNIQRDNEYDYKHKELIGTGSGGNRVYKIQNIHTKKYFALKKILLCTPDSKDFLNETNILQKINHPNIIKYYEGFAKKHKFYLILEFAEYGDLRKVITQHKKENTHFKQSKILFYIQQIAKSISYIHSKNILHRDIKPENIFICKDNVVKLGDFGISKELGSSINFTTTGLGTPYYISPEICKGEKYNHKSDIWAFGCLIYEMITLSRPFNYSNINALMYNIVNSPPTEIQNNGLYSKELIDLVKEMLNKSSEKRPSIKEVCLTIDNIMNNTIKKDNTVINNGTGFTSPLSKYGNNNGITLLNVLNSKPINFSKSSQETNIIGVNSQSPKKKTSNSSRSLINIFSGQNSNSKLNFHSKLFSNFGNNNNNNNCNNNNNGINQNSIVNNNSNNNSNNNHFVNHSNNINNYIKLTAQNVPVRNQSVPKRVCEHVEKTTKVFEIQKKKTEDLQKKVKNRFFSKETRSKKGSNGNQENRKHLIRNFLEEKYGKEMLIKIENCVQQDIVLLSDLLGEDEYLKNEKYFKYLSNS